MELFDKDPDQDDLLGRCGGGRTPGLAAGGAAAPQPRSSRPLLHPSRMKLDFGEVLKARVLEEVGAGAGGPGGGQGLC